MRPHRKCSIGRWAMLLLVGCVAPVVASGQNPNFDFSGLALDHWDPKTGPRGNCCQAPVGPGPSHVIFNTPGNDAVMGALLPRLPSGTDQVLRLGNPAGGGGNGIGWSVDYDITVDAERPLLHYQVAVVGDGTHSCEIGEGMYPPANGFFEAFIRNSEGQLLGTGTCSTYIIEACSDGVMAMTPSFNSIFYYPWASVGIDLSPYIGQVINLEFNNSTCYYAGFHGNSYAYVAPRMITPTDTLYYCRDSDTMVLDGLPRFKNYLWSTGDTTESITVNNPVDGASYTCTYTSFNGCSMQRTYVLRENPLQADFSYIPGACRELLFTDGSHAPAFGIAHWNWTFGDPPNDTDTTANTAHTYGADGTYTVLLTVQDSMGCVDSIAQQVVVDPISLTTLTHAMCQGGTFTFAQQVLTATGVYSDTLQTTIGCDSIVQLQLTVHPLPVSAFGAPPGACVQDSISFVNNTSGGASYQWDFGDGAYSTEQHAQHVFEQPGTYTVALMVQSAFGCADTTQHTIQVWPVPVAAFEADPLVASINHPHITFSDHSIGATHWEWSFGDGQWSAVQHSVHTYGDAGIYDVRLVVHNVHGCADTASIGITIIDELLVPNIFTPNGDGTNDTFRIRLGPGSTTAFALTIHNRWGQEVFSTTRPEQGWNGKVNGEPAPEGVYFYQLTLVSEDMPQQELRGAVQLVR